MTKEQMYKFYEYMERDSNELEKIQDFYKKNKETIEEIRNSNFYKETVKIIKIIELLKLVENIKKWE